MTRLGKVQAAMCLQGLNHSGRKIAIKKLHFNYKTDAPPEKKNTLITVSTHLGVSEGLVVDNLHMRTYG
jgi:hypothetical protein